MILFVAPPKGFDGADACFAHPPGEEIDPGYARWARCWCAVCGEQAVEKYLLSTAGGSEWFAFCNSKDCPAGPRTISSLDDETLAGED